MNCPKCGCEIGETDVCCPGCMLLVRKTQAAIELHRLDPAVWYWPDANIMEAARQAGIKAESRDMELEHTRKAVTTRLQELKDKLLLYVKQS